MRHGILRIGRSLKWSGSGGRSSWVAAVGFLRYSQAIVLPPYFRPVPQARWRLKLHLHTQAVGLHFHKGANWDPHTGKICFRCEVVEEVDRIQGAPLDFD